MQVFDHSLSIDFPIILNMAVISSGMRLSGQVGPESSEFLIYDHIFHRFPFNSFRFDDLFARKTPLISRVANFKFHQNRTRFSSNCLADSMGNSDILSLDRQISYDIRISITRLLNFGDARYS